MRRRGLWIGVTGAVLAAVTLAVVFAGGDRVAGALPEGEDPPPREIAEAVVSIGDVQVDESGGQAAFPLTLSRALRTSVTVSYSSTDAGSPVSSPVGHCRDLAVEHAPDNRAATGTVTFAPGETRKTIVVDLVDDAISECQESFVVALNSADADIASGGGRGTIVDNDAPPRLSISDAAVVEGGPNTWKQMVFTVTASGQGSYAITGKFDAHSRDATPAAAVGYDYQSSGGSFYVPGPADDGRYGSASVSVKVIGDGQPEEDEVFLVDLSAVSGATVANGRAQGKIGDDDGEIGAK